MDRNTLVAFFLIALIMIFTPYYMDIVSPPQEQQPAAQQTEIDSLAVVAPSKQSVASMPQKKSDRPVSVDEKFITVENSLYQATLSSINGGSFTSFSLKNYKQKDSSFVGLINGINKNNLMLSYLSEDGEIVELSEPWQISYESISRGNKKPSKISRFLPRHIYNRYFC
jgi:YidC/Oxa1 family membrane protein insertase